MNKLNVTSLSPTLCQNCQAIMDIDTTYCEFFETQSSILVHTICEIYFQCVCLCLSQVIYCIYSNMTYPVASYSMSNSIRY